MNGFLRHKYGEASIKALEEKGLVKRKTRFRLDAWDVGAANGVAYARLVSIDPRSGAPWLVSVNHDNVTARKKESAMKAALKENIATGTQLLRWYNRQTDSIRVEAMFSSPGGEFLSRAIHFFCNLHRQMLR